MLNYILAIGGLLLIALLELPVLIKEKKRKEAWVIGGILSLTGIFAILYIARAPIPSPMVLLVHLMQDVLNLSY